jgi:hypothetical protein
VETLEDQSMDASMSPQILGQAPTTLLLARTLQFAVLQVLLEKSKSCNPKQRLHQFHGSVHSRNLDKFEHHPTSASGDPDGMQSPTEILEDLSMDVPMSPQILGQALVALLLAGALQVGCATMINMSP